ncbi:MAG: hypothetical protein O3B01_25975 [Planctomycetota bacterium]|nr:hypothetical protein [Planctomycetota bacterium]MDA1142025.1 hypothetical protein [Planctomycetota bacterium]
MSKVSIGNLKKSSCIVRLSFCATEFDPNDSVLHIALLGNMVSGPFNDFAETGGTMRSMVKEFKDISPRGRMVVKLTPIRGQTLLSGIELIAQD